MRITLASSSPRRQELLRGLGVDFEIIPPREEERPLTDQTPEEYAEALALDKAREVLPQVTDGVVISADTIVVLEGRILGKPRDREEAGVMLRFLSGRGHRVITGICVAVAGERQFRIGSETTTVYFRNLSAGQVERYLDSGEPFDKAGGYGIQGLGSLLVERIEGCYFNVVGLPLVRLDKMLQGLGINLL